MRLEISEREVGDVTVLHLTGRLVLDDGDATLREHVETLVGRGRIRLVMNMADVVQIDSAGLGVLAAKYVSTFRKGGDLRFCLLTPRARRVLEITNLLKVFRVFDSEEAAVASYGAEAGAAH